MAGNEVSHKRKNRMKDRDADIQRVMNRLQAIPGLRDMQERYNDRPQQFAMAKGAEEFMLRDTLVLIEGMMD